MIWTTQRYEDWLRQEMDALFSNHFFGIPGSGDGEYPRVNIHSNDDELVLTANLPGIDVSTLDITCKDDTITIRGIRKQEPLQEGRAYLRQERSFGEFIRSFSLPCDIDAKQIAAKYKDGVLVIRLPRQAVAKPRKISVSVA